MPASATLPARPKRNEALSELRRAEILAAAIKVFGRKGFEAARAEEIAVAARIAKGTLYLYFKSKEAIYSAAVDQAMRELQREIERTSEAATGFRDRLRTAIRVRMEFWPEHEGIYRLLLTVGRQPRLRRLTNEARLAAHARMVLIFREGLEAGEIEPADFAALAWAALDLVRGATERRMDKLSAPTPQQDAVWISECLLRQVRFRRP